MAVKTYVKGRSTSISTNFKSSEFDCHGSGCCSQTKIDQQLVTYLQQIRNHFGKPLHVSSAFRCETHNKNVGGATGSYHIYGKAADIYIDGVTPAEIAAYAESIGIKGIGLYETDIDGFFVHIDTRTSKYFWYGQAGSQRSTFGGTTATKKGSVATPVADAKEIWDYLIAAGLNEYATAGLLGNLYAESGLKPANLQNTYEKFLGYTDGEYTYAVDNGEYNNFVNDQAGYGLTQLTYYTRKQAFLNYCKKKNKSIGDLTTQLEFLVLELKTDFPTVWTKLISATSVAEASNVVLLEFEKPYIANGQETKVKNTRASYGQNYYNNYATTIIKGGNGVMKYSDSNKPIVCMQTNSTCYKGTNTMTIKGVLWHSTGANNTTIKRYVQPSDDASDRAEMLSLIGKNNNANDWNHISIDAGLNAWIGKLADGTVASVQTMPWDYKPWGCGKGSTGYSCNDGWIQFEICEDNLTNGTYFTKVYEEACQLTAYLCQKYNIDPNGTVKFHGKTVPTILCHADAYDLGLGSNHSDVLHWFPKHGKTMSDVRNDIAKILGESIPVEEEPKVEENISTYEFKLKDRVKLVGNSTYSDGKAIPNWLFDKILYVRAIRDNGDIVISTVSAGAVSGVVNSTSLIPYDESQPDFKSYVVQITADVLNVRAGAGIKYAVNTQVKQHQLYTIVEEKDGWGRLKSGSGWISLEYTKRMT